MENKEKLESLIDSAWQEFAEIAKEEEDDDYSDAMLSMDRTRAEGFADGLAAAYHLVYDKEYTPKENPNVN
jgi:hypothetical protein